MSFKYLTTKGKLDLYCIFISSRYFEDINDYINLELSHPRFQGNLTKFFYNPISLTPQTFHFFPMLRTLHLYTGSSKIGVSLYFP